MPLLRTAMYAKGVELYCAPTVDDRETWLPTVRHIALRRPLLRPVGVPVPAAGRPPAGYPTGRLPRRQDVVIRGGSCDRRAARRTAGRGRCTGGSAILTARPGPGRPRPGQVRLRRRRPLRPARRVPARSRRVAAPARRVLAHAGADQLPRAADAPCGLLDGDAVAVDLCRPRDDHGAGAARLRLVDAVHLRRAGDLLELAAVVALDRPGEQREDRRAVVRSRPAAQLRAVAAQRPDGLRGEVAAGARPVALAPGGGVVVEDGRTSRSVAAAARTGSGPSSPPQPQSTAIDAASTRMGRRISSSGSGRRRRSRPWSRRAAAP